MATIGVTIDGHSISRLQAPYESPLNSNGVHVVPPKDWNLGLPDMYRRTLLKDIETALHIFRDFVCVCPSVSKTHGCLAR